MPVSNIDRLKDTLDELFMFDRADLDFGLYRIMNVRREEIRRFLDQDLLPRVRQALGQMQEGSRAAVEAERDALEKQLRDAGVDPASSPKFRELSGRYDAGGNTEADEAEVYGHLVSFFRRYYKEGDFISLRRYKEGVYAIPYEGEEVKLHWANADQYYIKSTEQFRDYTFLVSHEDEPERRVHFKLIEADTERNNNRAQAGQDRRFVLAGDNAAEEIDGELVVRFEYRPADGARQDSLNGDAEATILKDEAATAWRAVLERDVRREGAKDALTLLRKHLNTYTAKNTFDYFIHKDLGGFLRRELDFYVKNEVLRLDDIDTPEATSASLDAQLRKVKAIRAVGLPIIEFLTSLEEFQKRLWLKKRFVVETHWCVTLDRVPPDLYSEVAANDLQREHWVRLFAINELDGYAEPLDERFLEANRQLVVDTSLFDREFAARLIARLDDLDGKTDGLLVHSENFQALNLLHERYEGQVSGAYIDPPYNKGDGDFPYKDQYQQSSWLAMIRDRMLAGRELLTPDGVFLCSIGIEEHGRLVEMTELVFGADNFVAELVWEKGRKNDSRRFSIGHDYLLLAAKNISQLEHLVPPWREPKEGIREIIEVYEHLKRGHPGDFEKISQGLAEFYRELPNGHPSKRYARARYVDARGIWRDNNISWPGGGGPRYDVIHPITGEPCAVPRDGWRFVEDTMKQRIADGFVVFRDDHTLPPFLKSYIYIDGDPDSTADENLGQRQVMGSVFYRHSQPSNDWMKDLFGIKVFDNPKDHDILRRLIGYVAARSGTIIDYFAGSGSTAHAVIDLNRDQIDKRKYVLVEMGEYFDTVLKPRVVKAVYSKDWKDGKPVSREGVSQLIKVIHLESYEDTLANLRVERGERQASLIEGAGDGFREQYALRYWLRDETRGSASLLDLERFEDPWSYTLEVGQGSAAETKPVTVDLVETFNYLLGLRIQHVDHIRGVTLVQGSLPPGPRKGTGEMVLIIWRNTREMDAEALDKFLWGQRINPRDMEFDVIYVNGDNHLENSRRGDETWKVRLIEEEFHRLMFETAEHERKQ